MSIATDITSSLASLHWTRILESAEYGDTDTVCVNAPADATVSEPVFFCAPVHPDNVFTLRPADDLTNEVPSNSIWNSLATSSIPWPSAVYVVPPTNIQLLGSVPIVTGASIW